MNTQYKKKLLTGGGWVIFGFIVKTLIHLLISIILTRLFLPEKLGDYFLFNNVVQCAIIFSALGLPQTIIKILPTEIVKGKNLSISLGFNGTPRPKFFTP